MSKFSNMSLKSKILCLSLGGSLIVGVTSLGLLTYLDHSVEKDEVKGFYTHAQSFADAVEAQFYERYGDVQAFTLNPVFQGKNKSDMVDMLNNYAAAYGIYDLILYVDTKGHLVSVNSKDPSGKEIKSADLYHKDYSGEPWFQAALTGQTSDDKTAGLSGTFVEDPHFDGIVSDVFGEKRYGNGFSAPVKNAKGEVVGVISNRAGLRWIGYDLKNFYEAAKAEGHGSTSYTLVSKDGTVLMDLDPSNNVGWKNGDVAFDANQLTGQSWANEKEHPSVAALVKGQVGASIEKYKGEDYIVGYDRLNSTKFVSSMGWGVVAKAKKAEVMENFIHTERLFYGAQCFALFAIFCLSWFLSSSLAQSISNIILRIKERAENLAEVTTDVSASSVSLSESSTEQAAAIQETAASIDEVSAMIKKNSDNATESQKSSSRSKSAAEEGQQSVHEMIEAIDQIQHANSEIMTQVDAGNREFGEIVKVIAEIGNKTKVINDIVFQTKLLSFNASVEAARAGEHGKGFAVVAEEVGNLAQMSGNAAKEISTMLDASIRRVESIVTDTKTKVERLMQSGKATVENGTKTANRCGEALRNVLGTVNEVDSMVAEIATASREQSTGVNEINKAMNQLDQTTHQNTNVAQKVATTAEQLNAYSQDLNKMVQDLTMIVQGSTEFAGPNSETYAPETTSYAKKTQPKLSLVVHNKESHPVPTTNSEPSSYKKAVGADFVPSNDDPRFGGQ